jgi:hypothetical protein
MKTFNIQPKKKGFTSNFVISFLKAYLVTKKHLEWNLIWLFQFVKNLFSQPIHIFKFQKSITSNKCIIFKQ